MSDAQVYAGAALMGTVAGMRSMTAPAIVSRALGMSSVDGKDTGLGFLQSPVFPRVMGALAIAELIADKLPFVPSRTSAFPLIARGVSGAISGAALCSSKKRSAFFGALFGAAGAIAGTYVAYELRRRTVKALHVPDFLVALAEDAIAVSSGSLVTAKLKSLTAAA